MTCIPDFFIVGAPKCGTTSMYEYLRVHPAIFMPKVKEPHYFGSDLDVRTDRRTREEYLQLFAGSDRSIRRGESSVLYLFSRCAAREIHDFNPDARIIIMLREPVSAMVSWHGQLVSMMLEDILDFESAVRAQPERERGERLPNTGRMLQALQYTKVFTYTEQVQRYLEAFGTAQVHIIVLDDLIADAAGAYRALLRFLEVDDSFQPDFGVHNEKKWLKAPGITRMMKAHRAMRRSARLVPPGLKRFMVNAVTRVFPSPERPAIRPEFLAELRETCRPDIERLGALIGRDLSHWSAPKPQRQ